MHRLNEKKAILVRLYHNLNLHYPPTLVGQATLSHVKDENVEDSDIHEVQKDRIAALNHSLVR